MPRHPNTPCLFPLPRPALPSTSRLTAVKCQPTVRSSRPLEFEAGAQGGDRFLSATAIFRHFILLEHLIEMESRHFEASLSQRPRSVDRACVGRPKARPSRRRPSAGRRRPAPRPPYPPATSSPGPPASTPRPSPPQVRRQRPRSQLPTEQRLEHFYGSKLPPPRPGPRFTFAPNQFNIQRIYP